MSIAGVDRGHDLALMRIKPTQASCRSCTLGDSSAVSAGDRIYAIGNPLGVFDYSVTDGLISQVRQLSAELTILQISAPISQGSSSGGPLFNQFGEVIGVTTRSSRRARTSTSRCPANYLGRWSSSRRRSRSTSSRRRPRSSRTRTARARRTTTDDRRSGPHQIERRVPIHAVAVLDGCTQKDIEDIVQSIGEAIRTARRSTTQARAQGFEACFRIYEGTALKYEKDAPCKGVRAAFGDGLLRASSMASYKEKAWAMRDTFDGLLERVAALGAAESRAAQPQAEAAVILYLFDIDGTLLARARLRPRRVRRGDGRAPRRRRRERGHPLRRQDRSRDRRRDLSRAARPRAPTEAERAAFLAAYVPRLARAARTRTASRCSPASSRRSTYLRRQGAGSASRPATSARAPTRSSPPRGSPAGSSSAATAAIATCAPSWSRAAIERGASDRRGQRGDRRRRHDPRHHRGARVRRDGRARSRPAPISAEALAHADVVFRSLAELPAWHEHHARA